jgi:hypothetical protein
MTTPTSPQVPRSDWIIFYVVLIPALLISVAIYASIKGFRLYEVLDYLPHVQATKVYGHMTDWPAGEYRQCLSANDKINGEIPSIQCVDEKESEFIETVRVRYYGKTYRPDWDEDGGYLSWRCQSNGSHDPAVTCDKQSLYKFVPSKKP